MSARYGRRRRCVLGHVAATKQKMGTLIRPQVGQLMMGQLSDTSVFFKMLWFCGNVLSFFFLFDNE